VSDIREVVVSSLIWKYLERITSQLISFVLSIVLARLLAPENFGIISMVMVFINIANVFIISGFSTALVQKKDVNNIDYSSVFYFNILFSIVMYIAIYLLAPVISNFYAIDQLNPILRVLALNIPIAAIGTVQNAYIQKLMIFKKSFFASIIGTASGALIGIILAYLDYGAWALVAQQLATSFINMFTLWWIIKWRPTFNFSIKRLSGLLKYGWKILAGSLIDSVYNESRSLLIGKMYTAVDLAFYTKGKNFPELIVSNIDTTISTVLFPAISANQEKKDKMKALTRRAVKTSSYIIWPMMMGLAVISDRLIPLILTDKWLESIPYLKVACCYYALFPICSSNLQAIKATGHSDVYLKLEIVKKVTGILAMLFFIRYSVMAVVVSTLFTTILALFLNAIPNAKLITYGLKEQFFDLLPSAIITLGMIIIVYLISFLPLPDIPVLLLQVLSGLVVYLVLSRACHIEAYEYIIKMYQKKKVKVL